MSTSSVTPDQDSAPEVAMPGVSSSTLSSIVNNPSPQMPRYDNSDEQQTDSDLSGPTGNGSRLTSILKAVANVASTGLAGIPNKGRATFVNGLGEGARAEQAAQANQQDIKFKTFDDSLRAANLHNQDIELHMRQEEQDDAHQRAQDAQHDWDEAHGIQYDVLPNSGDAVTDHLTAQTTANGAATVPPGTHLSADGKSILIPKQTTDTQAGLLQKYNTFGPALGLPSLPQGAQFVPPKYVDMLQHKLGGYDINGEPINHDNLPGAIASLQTQRDALAASGNTTPDVLKQLDSTIGIYKANLKALDDHQADVFAKQTAQKAAQAKAVAEATLPSKEALQNNAAALKPQKPQNVDENGNPVWVSGASADEKKKAELAENMVFNINNVASILKRRPDIVGIVGGRFTNVQQMAGSNDPDIVALGTDIHNIGMANGGIHGMRSPQQAEDYSNQVLNHFKNGPKGVYGGLKSSADSVQTFIDAARPSTYKTHSSQGGAVRAMVPQGQQQ